MKKLFWITILLAVLAAFFASSQPDGLEFIAEKLGFLKTAQERTAPMPDYSVGFLPEGGISTSTAGVAGILITLAIFWLTVYIMKKGGNGMKTLNSLFLISCFLLLAAPAFAARPLVTDDFGTVDPGKYELEAGYSTSTPKTGGASADNLGFSFKRGFTSNFDFGVELPYSLTAPSRLGDAILHAKLRLLEQGENDGLTGRLDVKLANGDANQGLGTGFTDYTAMVIYSKAFGDIRTHYNLSYTIVGVPAGAPEANTMNYAAAAEKELSSAIEIVGEYYGTSFTAGSTANVQLGGRWQALENLRLDAGYSLALNDNSNNVATAGLTAEF